jgi:hypothetical protein
MFLCTRNFCLALQESLLKVPISDIKARELGRVRNKRKEGEGKYYGRSGENLTAYREEFCRLRTGKAVADPIESGTDETAVVAIAPKKHGCYPVLDGVITPAVSYTQL